MYRYFTSVTLAEWALDHNFTIVGTMTQDWKGISKDLKVMKNWDERSVLYVQDGEKNIMFVSYIDKKKSGKKNIIGLTTLHDTAKFSNDKRSKPQDLVMYNHTKGDVDNAEWPLNGFAFILDTERTNSWTKEQTEKRAEQTTILSDSKVKLSNFDFTYALGKALVLPSIQNRYQNNNGIQLPILLKIRCVLGIKETNMRPLIQTSATLFGRSHVCVQEIVGSSQYRKMQQNMNNKIKSKCACCFSLICKKHIAETESICRDCADE